MIACHPDPKNWIKWAKFEEDRQKIGMLPWSFDSSSPTDSPYLQ
jgi:hypothetical protein